MAKAGERARSSADLNPEQRKAVTHVAGPQLIVAGAGTGKTTVIARRIAWLILERGVPPDGVLALTFTEKAATEMEERVDRLLPYGYVDLWISTFHGFCEKLLKRHALDIGIPNDFTLLDETGAWMLMHDYLDRFSLDYYRPRGNPTKFLHALHQHFSRCKDEAVTPEDYLAYAKSLHLNADSELKRVGTRGQEIVSERTIPSEATEAMRIAEVAEAYHIYQRLLLDEGALDFGDLLVYALRLLRERPAILERYRSQFQSILVDEFQDTNWAQYEIVKLLAAPKNNLTVVGDDDQSIYAFRGASMSNILHFQEDFPSAAEVAITTNYRSKQRILDGAYRLIGNNNPNRLEVTLGLSKELTAAAKGTGAVEVLAAPDSASEAQMVVERILELKGGPTSGSKDATANWNDFAILVRANRQADQFLPVLQSAGIPYQFLASRGLFRKPIILDIIAYLKLLDDYHENTAMYHVLNGARVGFSYDDILRLTNWAQRKSWSLYEVLRNIRSVPGISKDAAAKAEALLAMIATHTDLARTGSVRDVLLAYLEASGLLEDITDEETAEDHEMVQWLNAFWKHVEAFQESVDAPTVKAFISRLELARNAGDDGALPIDPNAGPDAVKVLTVHAAKGLEFRYVFIVNCIEQRFPSTDRSDPIELPDTLTKVIAPEGDLHIEEERRLFYVAATRAKEGLFCTYAEDYGGVRKRKPSRFLEELGVLPVRHSEGARATEESHAPVRASKGVRSLATTHDSRLTTHDSPPAHALPSKLSFTQIRAYETCPWQYHYAHILRIPLRGRYVFSFGQTMHLTLQRFFDRVLERSSAHQGELFGAPSSPAGPTHAIPSLEDVLQLYERAWIDDWYGSKAIRQEYYEKGKHILKEFHAKHETVGWPAVHATEQPFTVKFGASSVMGKADRIDMIAGGVEIIDYKTGTAHKKLEADDKTQLLIYQVAASQALGLTPKLLSYYYLDNNTKVSFLGSDRELDVLAQKVEAIGANIAAGKFEPNPGRQCKTCDFKNICPYAQA